MQVYNGISVACLVLMAIGVCMVVISLLRKNRAERIHYVRNFKKGKAMLIYIVAIPLYWMGTIYAGMGMLDGLFEALNSMIELVILKYETDVIQSLLSASLLYKITVYTCFVLVGLNALLFIFSIVRQYLWSGRKKLKFKFSRREKLVLFGNNEQNYSIYASERKRAKILVDKISDEASTSLFMQDIAYHSVVDVGKYAQKLVKKCAKKRKTIICVVNTGNDEENIKICRTFIQKIEGLQESERLACFGSLKIFVFGNPECEAIFENIVTDSYGCISYVNKYQKIAMDFISRYPFTLFMDEKHVDYRTSLVKSGVKINAFFIGFGRTNQQIFLTSVANNQFITATKGGVDIKKVNYHVFDKTPVGNNKNLNHNYYRYKNEFKGFEKGDYLPLPAYPAKEFFHHLDVNDVNFYQTVRKFATQSRKAVNFVVIAFGSDLENIDMAQKLVFKRREWGIQNLYVFVKLRKEHEGQKLLEEAGCYFIGNEEEVVYNMESILGDRIFKMAQMRNEVYDLEYELVNSEVEITPKRIQSIKENAYRNWYVRKSQLERDSSLYCCLSLRSKLNMMGLDYCDKGENTDPPLTEEDYLQLYAQEDMPDLGFYKVTADGKPIVHYSLDFLPSRRRNLAIHEHLRWNSYMISKGVVPASKRIIMQEMNEKNEHTNGKNYTMRRHGNITTFKGLEQFRRMIAERDKKPEQTLKQVELKKDVIKYDYQLLDDAYWLLSTNGYKIVRKKSVEELLAQEKEKA